MVYSRFKSENAWLETQYEVFAKRDERYLDGLVKELESEAGNLYLLKTQTNTRDEMVGLYAEWGLEKIEKQKQLENEENKKSIFSSDFNYRIENYNINMIYE